MSQQGSGLRDQLSIETPELVSIEFPVAGVGSRALALSFDYLLQGVGFVLLILPIVLFAPSRGFSGAEPHGGSQKWAIALIILTAFLLHWGYFTLFEAFWNGQTPGKRIMRLRVIQQTGRPIGFFESVGRNFVRFIDFLPAYYLVGAICVFATRRQQRLGDMVAGTLVVHEPKIDAPLWRGNAARTFTAAALDPPAERQLNRFSAALPADAVARLGAADLEVIESFLARRLDLPLDTRDRLAEKLVKRMSAKLQLAAPADTNQETFLEGLAHDLRSVHAAAVIPHPSNPQNTP